MKRGDRHRIDDLLAYDDAAFIEVAYRAALGREPDEDGMRNYLTMLRGGASKIQVLGWLHRSREGRRHNAAIVGLTLRYLLDSSLRWPVIGAVIAGSMTPWKLWIKVRSRRRVANDIARRLAELAQRLDAIEAALSGSEGGRRQLAVNGEEPSAVATRGNKMASDHEVSGDPMLASPAHPMLPLERTMGAPGKGFVLDVARGIQAIADHHGPRVAVEFAYSYILGRRADATGLSTKCDALLKRRTTVKGICAELFTSEEYRVRAPRRHRDPAMTVSTWAAVERS
jgi:alpha-D-ribose 1-methylphosphonate 5-triphosphate synthase subunit PhnG